MSENQTDSIEDLMDDAMMPYTNSALYKSGRDIVETLIVSFRKDLSPEMQKQFNIIVDKINEEDARFAVKAFEYGYMTCADMHIDEPEM